MPLKHSISSPLEAGTSLFDGRSMPIYISKALEYTSKKLARKDMHLTLVVVRRDYELPSTITALPSRKPSLEVLTTQASAISQAQGCSTHKKKFSLSSIRRRVRGNTFPAPNYISETDSPIQERVVDFPSTEQLRSYMVSPALSISSIASSASTVSTAYTVQSSFDSPRQGWPMTPATPYSVPATPATPYSVVSSSTHATTTEASESVCGSRSQLLEGLNPIGIKLVHVSPLTRREERTLRHVMQKTEKKFLLGPHWFPDTMSPSECGLNADVMHQSLVQNEVLFSSDGLTLLGLDHLYTFKSALASYTATQVSSKLEDAVDELRRLVLGQGGRKLALSVLQSSYTWLGPVGETALRDVTRMYRRAYGGLSGEIGLEEDVEDMLISNATFDTTICASPESWPLLNEPFFIIDTAANTDNVPAPETPAFQPHSESNASSIWDDREDQQSTTASTSAVDKRLGMIDIDFRFGFDFEAENFYRLSHTRDLLTEQEEAEAAAWAAAGSSSETADRADGIRIGGIDELAAATKQSSPLTPTAGEDFLPFTLLFEGRKEDEEQERTTPKLPEKPRLQLQTPSSPLLITKPVALRMPPPLKLQTSFVQKPIAISLPAVTKHLPPLKTQPTFDLVGMTPIETRLPSFLAQRNHPEEEEDGEDLTAKPISGHPSRTHRWTRRWDGLGIDERLTSPLVEERDDGGPSTPNGYDDISPITRGEWGFLFKGDTWVSGRTVRVEMC